MKKIYFLLLALLFSVIGYAQNVTVNPGGGSYATLADAFNAINSGTHTGAITITVVNNTTEPAAGAILAASGTGSASYTSVLIRPAGTRVITGAAAAGLPLIDFNGADNVTIDGLKTAEGDSLTISNTTVSNTAGTATIRFRNDASNNTITNCRVLGSFTAALGVEGGNIVFGAAVTTGNDNNTVSNSDIGPAGSNLPSRGIHLGGTSDVDPGAANSGNTITGNNIYNYFSASQFSSGINNIAGSVRTIITNNRFYQTGARQITSGTATTHSAIRIINANGFGYQISGNTIGYASATGTGVYQLSSSTTVAHAFVGIVLTVGTTTATSVQGNTITAIAISGSTASNGFQGTGGSGPFRGISVAGGLVNIGDVTGNTIGSMTATESITFTTGSASASDLYGIFSNSTAALVTSNNYIGGIKGSNTNATQAAVSIYGIRSLNAATPTWICSNNTIGGDVANSLQSTTAAAGTTVQGITNAGAAATINGNIIRNMTTAGGTGTTTAASVIGINNNAGTTNHTISRNTIYNLSNTSAADAAVVTGIQFNGSTGANLVERNFIYGLTAATTSASAEINGIRTGGGTVTYQNNVIALGAGVSNAIGAAASNTTNTGINGINEVSGINNFWHNSIYIGGTATAGSGASYAFNGTQVTETRSFRNNIFFNARTNSGASGKHYAVKINGTAANPAGLTINNNIYYVNGTDGIFGFFNEADVASLSAWKTAVGQDANSFESNPQFINPAASTPDLHINPAAETDAEGNGANLGVVNDFDGDARGTIPDIGADEFISLACTAVGGSATADPTGPFCGSGSSTISATGYSTTGGTTYLWQSSTDAAFTSPTDIGTASTTYADLNTGTITNTTYYRLKVACAGNVSTAYSNTITITINPASVGGTAGSNQSICTGDTPANITLSGQTGNVIRWEYSTDAAFTSPVTIANTTTTLTGAEIGTLSADRWFRAVVQAGSCATANSSAVKVTVNAVNTIALSSAAGTDAQTLCEGTAITNITYATTGATGASFSGLPTGVIGSWNANVVTISGNPSVSGTFNYTVTLTGGCGTVTANGSISVTAQTVPTFTQLGAYCVDATPGILPTTSNNGITGTWNPATISTSTAGTTTYTFTPDAGQCAAVATMNITVSSGTIVPTFTQIGPLCVGATAPVLPGTSTNGINGTWSPATISTAAVGTTTYTFTPVGGQCAASTTMDITVNPNSTITLTSAGGTDAQTLCVNTAITNITYSTTVATGATVSGLPAGVTGSWNANVLTISGTPTAAGTFSYTVNLTGGCGNATASGSITVNANVSAGTISGSSPLCIGATATYTSTGTAGGTWSSSNTAVATVNPATGLVTAVATGTANIIYTVSSGCGAPVTASASVTVSANVTAGTVSGTATLCAAATATFTASGTAGGTWSSSNTAVATVNPTTGVVTGVAAGTANIIYTLSSGCGAPVSASASVNVIAANTITLTSAAGTNAQAACVNSAITNITYSTAGATGATFSGLPAGVTGSWNANVVTISGTPTATGNFNYTVTLTGGCGTTTANGSISVAARTTPTFTQLGPYCIGATAPALPATSNNGIAGTWSPAVINTATAGTTTYTFTPAAGLCANTATMNITITPANTATLTSAVGTNAQAVCISNPITNITYSTTGATGATFSGLPTGVTGTWAANVATIRGAPNVAGTFNYTVTLTGGCGTVTATGSIQVNPTPVISIAASAIPVIGPYQQVTLRAATNAPDGGVFTWLKDGEVVPGATDSTLIVNYSALGSYRLRFTNTNGCIALSNDLLVSSQSTNEVLIWPNPSNGQFRIKFDSRINERVTVKVYTPSGQALSNDAVFITTNNMTIEVRLLQPLPSGLYTIHVIGAYERKQWVGRVMLNF